jgi:hypothetical protein
LRIAVWADDARDTRPTFFFGGIDFGKLDQHMKELWEIDKEPRAANKINLQPDFHRLASPETPDKASEEFAEVTPDTDRLPPDTNL